MENKNDACRARRKKIGARLRRGWFYFAEFTLVGIASHTIPHLSRRGVCRMSYIVGWLYRKLDPRTLRVARDNIEFVYGDTKTAAEKNEMLTRSYNNFSRVVLEYFWFSRHTEQRLKTHICMADPVIKRWVAGDFPGLFVTAHLGNWELGGQYIAHCGRTMTSVYRPIGTSKTLKKLLTFRGATGQHVVPKEGAMINLVRAFRAGNLVAMLLDQHTDVSEGGVYRDFFGLEAAFSGAPGIITHRLGVPICIAAVVLNPDEDKYYLHTIRELTAAETKAMSPADITATIVAELTKMITMFPDQWLWGYRRWKRYGARDDAALYPFYARTDIYKVD